MNHLDRVRNQRRQVQLLPVQCHPPGFQLRQVQELIDQRIDLLRLLLDDPRKFLRHPRFEIGVVEHVCIRHDGGKGRPNFMHNVRDPIALLKQPRILHGNRRDAGENLQNLDIFDREIAARRQRHAFQHPDNLVAKKHGHGDNRTWARNIAHAKQPRVGAGIGQNHLLPIAHHPSGQALFNWDCHPAQFSGGRSAKRGETEEVGIYDQQNRGCFQAQQVARALNDLREQHRHFTRGIELAAQRQQLF
ncbi:MAG: hypothetical protein BWY63_03854 [Chloroflexi bacterium ADurb.Bin360]|nr:MAG: hypothetical protein BWY63_03854 [Chloroflexi bacterium ADurb.Bin360]